MTLSTACPKPQKRTDEDKTVAKLVAAWGRQKRWLRMDSWHTCETTHCRGGWVVALEGKEGKALEKQTSTLFAAMQIYKASAPDLRVAPTRFFEKNDVAMQDIKRMAELEVAGGK